MTRLRKGKHAKAGPLPSKDYNGSAVEKTSNDKNDLLKSQIIALGGNEDDYHLVKRTQHQAADGPSDVAVDAELAGDVRKFVQGLGLKQFSETPESSSLAGMSTSPRKASKQRTQNPDAGKSKGRGSKHAPEAPASIANKASTAPPKAAKQKQQKSLKMKVPDGATPGLNETTTSAPTIEKSEVVKMPSKVPLKQGSYFLVPPSAQWYTSMPPISKPSSSLPSITPSQLTNLTSRASELHQKDIATYQTSSSSSSEAGFLAKIISSGTLSDRLSALTLLVQSSPLHNTKSLETLRSMAERGKGKGGREESLKALRCIVDWWVGGGVPDRKLKYFRDQALLHPDVSDQHLLLWYFEDWLKKYFFSILQILETLLSDSLPYVRTQSLNLISALLRAKPEQEQNLLRLLVNKLGDHEKSICARASYHLLQLLQAHPSMKSIVIREITALVLKPIAQPISISSHTPTPNKHIRFTDDEPKPKPKVPEKKDSGNPHARYYATITLNQIILAAGDKAVALQLLDVYFEMFKELLGEGSPDDKDNTAEGDVEGEGKEVRKDKKGRVLVNEKKRRGKGGKEVQGAAGFMEVEDSQSKLISAILTGINRALPFAKITAEDVGLQKHIDTLFIVTHKSTFNISLQALVLIQHIAASLSQNDPSSSSKQASPQAHKPIVDRYYRSLYASLHDPRLPLSSKQAMYLNLFFKSVKGDHDSERVQALIRRFVQVLVSGGSGATEFVAGGLYLLGELFASIPGLRSMINTPSNTDAETYDPRKRDPQYAHASSSPLWELTPLLDHYHPTISLHARQLLSSQPLTASADLSLNTLSHFLDRFVFKNPKKPKSDKDGPGVLDLTGGKPKGSSMMQPAASAIDGASGVKLMKGEVGDPGGLVNDDAFLRRRPEDIPVDQIFFHKYFVRKHEQERAAVKAKKGKGDEDEEEQGDEDDDGGEHSIVSDAAAKSSDKGDSDDKEAQSDEDSDPEEAEVWKAMKASMPKVTGDDDLIEDSDIDSPPDFDSDISLGSEDDDESASEDDDDPDSGDSSSGAGSDEDALALVEDSDADDLIPLDGDAPDGLIEYDGSDGDEDEEEEWGGVSETKKRKRTDNKSSFRKKLKSLPTFASYDEYAKMIEDGPEDFI